MAATGDGVDGSPQSHDVVNVIKGWNPDSFSYLGDVYTNGTAYEFDTWYGEAGGYGDLRAITNPVIGNHEYRPDVGATPYFEYWGGVPHYYSYDVGGWHVVVLDTNTEFAQTAVGSEQYQWVDADLAAHQSQCTIVLQHQPRYAEVPGSRSYLQDLWSLALPARRHPPARRARPQVRALDADGPGRQPGRRRADPDRGRRRRPRGGHRVHARTHGSLPAAAWAPCDLTSAQTTWPSPTPMRPVSPSTRAPFPAVSASWLRLPPAPDPTGPGHHRAATPTALTAKATSTTAARLTWRPASDAVGVTATSSGATTSRSPRSPAAHLVGRRRAVPGAYLPVDRRGRRRRGQPVGPVGTGHRDHADAAAEHQAAARRPAHGAGAPRRLDLEAVPRLDGP